MNLYNFVSLPDVSSPVKRKKREKERKGEREKEEREIFSKMRQ